MCAGTCAHVSIHVCIYMCVCVNTSAYICRPLFTKGDTQNVSIRRFDWYIEWRSVCMCQSIHTRISTLFIKLCHNSYTWGGPLLLSNVDVHVCMYVCLWHTHDVVTQNVQTYTVVLLASEDVLLYQHSISCAVSIEIIHCLCVRFCTLSLSMKLYIEGTQYQPDINRDRLYISYEPPRLYILL